MLKGYQLVSRDLIGMSDPYLKITLGDKCFNERKNYQLDCNSPDFYKCFKFQTSFPGAPTLKIEVFDYDDLFGDDLIGATSIDLDDRFFNINWQKLEYKPIEYRNLYDESSSLAQGNVSMWLDIDENAHGKGAK